MIVRGGPRVRRNALRSFVLDDSNDLRMLRIGLPSTTSLCKLFKYPTVAGISLILLFDTSSTCKFLIIANAGSIISNKLFESMSSVIDPT